MSESEKQQRRLRPCTAFRRSVPTSQFWYARLPDGSGIDVCREIRSRHPDVRCLILTSFGDEALFSAVMAGVSDHILKQVAGQP
jgi:DNA-binding NarL/FixJ family response regulator